MTAAKPPHGPAPRRGRAGLVIAVGALVLLAALGVLGKHAFLRGMPPARPAIRVERGDETEQLRDFARSVAKSGTDDQKRRGILGVVRAQQGRLAEALPLLADGLTGTAPKPREPTEPTEPTEPAEPPTRPRAGERPRRSASPPEPMSAMLTAYYAKRQVLDSRARFEKYRAECQAILTKPGAPAPRS